MAKEIERRFLVNDPMLFKNKKFIRQGYVLLEKNKQLRVRIIGKKSLICLKYTEKMVRDEYEYEIPYSDGMEILSKCEFVIEKYRSTIKLKKLNYTIDIDRYPNGIVVAEVEFKNEKDSKKFQPLSWFGKEITGDKKYSNITFAKQRLRF